MKIYTFQIVIIIYIYYSYVLQLFAQHDKLEKLLEYAGVCETVMIHHMSDLEPDPEEGFFVLSLGRKTI